MNRRDPSTSPSGFTLLELTTSMLVVGLIASVALVNLGAVRARGQDEAAALQVRGLVDAAELYRVTRDDRGGYDPSDPLLTTTYYGAADQVTATRKPEVVAASTHVGEVSFGLSDEGRLLSAAVRSASGNCVVGVGWPWASESVVTVVPGMSACSAFAQGWDSQLDAEQRARIDAAGDATAPTWTSTDSEPHRRPDGSPINRAPFAADDHADTDEDLPVVLDVLANDHDLDGDTLAVAEITPPTAGDAQLTDGGRVRYTPAPDVSGTDEFSYTATDGRGGTFVALVVVDVAAANDAPHATDDQATTDADTPVDIDVLEDDRDPDGDVLTVTVAAAPSHGSATVLGDGTVRYVPDPDRTGADTFRYAVADPAGLTATATVDVVVTSTNDSPVAADDTATTDEDSPVVVDVLANDTDPDGDALQVGSVGDPGRGQVVDNGDGTLTYFPAPDDHGTIAIGYDALDDAGAGDTAVLRVTITPANDTPVARRDPATTGQDQPVTVVVLDNDTDGDGDALQVVAVTQPGTGTARVSQDHTVTFTPAPGATGTTSFTYTVADPSGASAVATVEVDVLPADDTTTVCLVVDQQTRAVWQPRAQEMVDDGEATWGTCGHDDVHEGDDAGSTVTICHKPGTPAEKTMQLPSSGARGHFKHGDYEGPCRE